MAHILVIEYDELVRDLVARTLRRAGHTAEAVATYDGWLGSQKQLRPDLIVMDIGRTQQSGPALIGRVRRSPLSSDIPLLAMSAITLPGDDELAREVGAVGLVAKPFDPREFLACVAAAMLRTTGPSHLF